mmetsp:Transcript_8827/g.19066  ORF Transcript_8827/g.19066 Transcript_8827/m.19066 type:complete len:233 (-) Transcript_8827:11-709(-)
MTPNLQGRALYELEDARVTRNGNATVRHLGVVSQHPAAQGLEVGVGQCREDVYDAPLLGVVCQVADGGLSPKGQRWRRHVELHRPVIGGDTHIRDLVAVLRPWQCGGLLAVRQDGPRPARRHARTTRAGGSGVLDSLLSPAALAVAADATARAVGPGERGRTRPEGGRRGRDIVRESALLVNHMRCNALGDVGQPLHVTTIHRRILHGSVGRGVQSLAPLAISAPPVQLGDG